MADDNEVRAVLLGTVQERQAVDDRAPTACKAGGTPAWYNSSKPPQEAETLECPRCRKALFLVAQVYAPVDADRSLYVFGCNAVECTETPGSWRVLRDQDETPVVEAASTAASEDAKAVAFASAPEVSRSAWDAGDDSDGSDWGDGSDDDAGADADDPFDLEKLLLQRDDAMSAATSTSVTTSKKHKQSAASASASLTSTATAAAAPASSRGNVFPARLIEVIDEPYEDYASENDYSHENALLEDYMKQEEEEKSTDVGDLRKLLSSAKKGKQVGGGGGKASSSGESYEKTPAQQRHFMRFQKRISRCPLQCLRYDYGGEPLWPVPKPQGIRVPKCVCGAERVFELQLTPTINYFLKVDQFASPVAAPTEVPTSAPVVVSGSSDGDNDGCDDDDECEEGSETARSRPTGSASAAATTKSSAPAGGGMDWLSVVVYCCPKSCSRSREEFVFVLPAEKS